MKKVISILLAVILIAAMFAGCKGKKATVSDYSGMENVQAMVEYAEQLEAEGNTEAAAQVWALIPGAADESAREELRNEAEGSNEMQAFESMGEANDIINSIKRGK